MPVHICKQADTVVRSDGLEAPTIVVGLVNNMPDGAIAATEQQFARLLGGASDGLNVKLVLYSMSGLPRTEDAQKVLLRGYRSTERLPDDELDALIVTGTEPRAASLRQEAYWPALANIIDWAEENTLSSIWSCLGAHAAVLHMDGVDRHLFDTKLSGLFECVRLSDHDLIRDTPDRWMVPHSRRYGLKCKDLIASGYSPLTLSATAGVDIFIKQRRSMFVYFQGHLEYDSDALFKEYMRDIGRYIDRERDDYPEMPRDYFDPETAAQFSDYRQRVIEHRAAGGTTRIPIGVTKALTESKWRQPGTQFYRNWLRWLQTRKTEQGTRPKYPRSSAGH